MDGFGPSKAWVFGFLGQSLAWAPWFFGRLTAAQDGPQVRRAALLARVTARSSALAGLDELDRKKREVGAKRVDLLVLAWPVGGVGFSLVFSEC